MAAKFIQHIKSESFVDFVKEAQNMLDGETKRQVREVEDLLIKRGSLVNEDMNLAGKSSDKLIEEKLTRKHFQMAADTIKAIANKSKRKELAHHHAETFAKSNPRFDRKRFMHAAGVEE